MKITKLRTELVSLPFEPPVAGGQGITLASCDCILTFLETDSGGPVGEGLIFSINGWRLSVLHEMVKSLEPLVVGREVSLGGGFFDDAWKAVGFLGHSGASIMGMAAVDNAMWDLRAKAAGLNVSRLIGTSRTAVPAYHSGRMWVSDSIDEIQNNAAEIKAKGYKAMKMRIGRASAEEDVRRVRAVRQAIGDDVALMVDINQQLDVAGAIRRGRMLEEFNLGWIEEPVAYHNHRGEAEIAAALDTPIASGETEYTPMGMLEMLRLGSADILQPDLQRMGGPTGFLRAAAIAQGYNVGVTSHLFAEMNLPLIAATPNAIYLEHIAWFSAIYAEQIEIDANGDAIVPDRPGWGFSFDPKAREKYRIS
jgi:L-alanine-DL-glutamate epimerase-like enolase superfamily enzyme